MAWPQSGTGRVAPGLATVLLQGRDGAAPGAARHARGHPGRRHGHRHVGADAGRQPGLMPRPRHGYPGHRSRGVGRACLVRGIPAQTALTSPLVGRSRVHPPERTELGSFEGARVPGGESCRAGPGWRVRRRRRADAGPRLPRGARPGYLHARPIRLRPPDVRAIDAHGCDGIRVACSGCVCSSSPSRASGLAPGGRRQPRRVPRPPHRADRAVGRPAPLLGGRDLEAGGTWLGVDRGRRFGLVTNVRELARPRPAPSRGRLVPQIPRRGPPATTTFGAGTRSPGRRRLQPAARRRRGAGTGSTAPSGRPRARAGGARPHQPRARHALAQGCAPARRWASCSAAGTWTRRFPARPRSWCSRSWPIAARLPTRRCRTPGWASSGSESGSTSSPRRSTAPAARRCSSSDATAPSASWSAASTPLAAPPGRSGPPSTPGSIHHAPRAAACRRRGRSGVLACSGALWKLATPS